MLACRGSSGSDAARRSTRRVRLLISGSCRRTFAWTLRACRPCMTVRTAAGPSCWRAGARAAGESGTGRKTRPRPPGLSKGTRGPLVKAPPLSSLPMLIALPGSHCLNLAHSRVADRLCLGAANSAGASEGNHIAYIRPPHPKRRAIMVGCGGGGGLGVVGSATSGGLKHCCCWQEAHLRSWYSVECDAKPPFASRLISCSGRVLV